MRTRSHRHLKQNVVLYAAFGYIGTSQRSVFVELTKLTKVSLLPLKYSPLLVELLFDHLN